MQATTGQETFHQMCYWLLVLLVKKQFLIKIYEPDLREYLVQVPMNQSRGRPMSWTRLTCTQLS